MTCATCGVEKLRHAGEVNRANRTGAKLYCSVQCAARAKETKTKALGWHARRFEERPSAVQSSCAECGKTMWLPASKVNSYKRCGPECNLAWRERITQVVVINGRTENRERPCETCGTLFTARPNLTRGGQGRFCSQKCNRASHEALTSPENLARAQQARRDKHAAGLIPWKTGPAHHAWKGGKSAALKRLRDSGVQAERLRIYRAKNPDKVREFTARRKGRKLGRLEYGCIKRIGTAQGWKCAICRASVKGRYHVDHIMPLARGGAHEARNIQLLCRRCNVRKSAKDPIDYMRELGRLL